MAIRIYRLARWLWLHRVPGIPWLLKSLNRIVFAVVLPPSARLGHDVLLSYEGLGTVIHRHAVIGNHVTIGTGISIGGRAGHSQVPAIDEGAMIGSGAKVLGPLRVGKYASIGANAVVLTDVPDYGVAVGVPSRVARIDKPEDVPNYRAYRESRDAT
jgi:serine O-acetyltransferase